MTKQKIILIIINTTGLLSITIDLSDAYINQGNQSIETLQRGLSVTGWNGEIGKKTYVQLVGYNKYEKAV